MRGFHPFISTPTGTEIAVPVGLFFFFSNLLLIMYFCKVLLLQKKKYLKRGRVANIGQSDT